VSGWATDARSDEHQALSELASNFENRRRLRELGALQVPQNSANNESYSQKNSPSKESYSEQEPYISKRALRQVQARRNSTL